GRRPACAETPPSCRRRRPPPHLPSCQLLRRSALPPQRQPQRLPSAPRPERRRSSSSEHGQEGFVQLAVVVEDSGAESLVVPGDGGLVGVVDVATGEHLVSVTRRVKKVPGLPAGDAVTRGADVDRSLRTRQDVGCPQHLLPTAEL